jgi:flavin reductase (DIM6/NTAB) family NADH-FMN oxidoreductase RutF
MLLDPKTMPAREVYRFIIAAVVPRPIAFVSTMSPAGVLNLAPFSFFNAFCADPPVVGFCPVWRNPAKDTITNVRATREFVVNIVGEDIAEAMNVCSAEFAPDVDEFQQAKLTPVPSLVVKPPRVKESRINMECSLLQVIDFSEKPHGGSLVLGQVVRMHVDDEIIDAGYKIDADKLRAIGRMGGPEYARTRDRFAMIRPSAPVERT